MLIQDFDKILKAGTGDVDIKKMATKQSDEKIELPNRPDIDPVAADPSEDKNKQ